MSSEYAVLLTPAAQRDVRKLPPGTKERLRSVLLALGNDPRTKAQKLAGRDSYRVRVGDYRIVFRVNDRSREVLVARIKHRGAAYRQR